MVVVVGGSVVDVVEVDVEEDVLELVDVLDARRRRGDLCVSAALTAERNEHQRPHHRTADEETGSVGRGSAHDAYSLPSGGAPYKSGAKLCP
jgi:hypothetical protein